MCMRRNKQEKTIHERLANRTSRESTDFQTSIRNKNILKSFLLGLLTVLQCMIDMNPIRRGLSRLSIFQKILNLLGVIDYFRFCKLPSNGF